MKHHYFIKQFLGALIFFSLLFISAGKLFYWQGVVYTCMGIAMLVLQYTAFSLDADLLQERSGPKENTKSWDKKILGFSFLLTLAMFIVAGLDSGRFHWSFEFHWSLYVLGGIFTLAGQLLFLIAQKQNKFFSSTVRIQNERGHSVCDTGLYRVVRHPAYMGSFIQAIGFPLLFGSLWSIIPVGLSVGVLLLRTYLEDTTLIKELDGYKAYTQKTQYRIIPYIW